ncbi:MAG: helix-turn-helix domain-containing protein, partial [Candidatus Xenobia bacterium]
MSLAPVGPDLTAQGKPGRARVAKVYTPSERARAVECAAHEGVSAASKKLGITRFSIYEWRRRAALCAQGKLEDSPVGGRDDPSAAARDGRILKEWKAHPGLGPSQVRNQLRRQGLKVSVHTVRCVLEANGYVPPKVRRTTVHDQRYESVRP